MYAEFEVVFYAFRCVNPKEKLAKTKYVKKRFEVWFKMNKYLYIFIPFTFSP